MQRKENKKTRSQLQLHEPLSGDRGTEDGYLRLLRAGRRGREAGGRSPAAEIPAVLRLPRAGRRGRIPAVADHGPPSGPPELVGGGGVRVESRREPWFFVSRFLSLLLRGLYPILVRKTKHGSYCTLGKQVQSQAAFVSLI